MCFYRPKFHCVDLYGDNAYKTDIDINLSIVSMGLLGVKAESSNNFQEACWITCLYQVANRISYFILKSQVLSGSWSNIWVCHLNQFIKSKGYFALNEHILLCWVFNQLSIIKMFLLLLTSLFAINGTIIFCRKVFNVGEISTHKLVDTYQCVQIISSICYLQFISLV